MVQGTGQAAWFRSYRSLVPSTSGALQLGAVVRRVLEGRHRSSGPPGRTRRANPMGGKLLNLGTYAQARTRRAYKDHQMLVGGYGSSQREPVYTLPGWGVTLSLSY